VVSRGAGVFDLKTAVRQFELSEDRTTDLFKDVGPIEPSDSLRAWLDELAPAALAINTEQARREYIIAPVLVEAKRRSEVEINVFPGIAFTVDLGSGYDIVLIPNFLHHFDAATNESLLRKVHAALKPSGIVLAPDFIPNEDRITPERDAMFSLQMLGATPHGDAYTFTELEAMFGNAGFTRSELRDLSPHPQRLVVSYK
jgi:hypothetical protein